MLTPTQLIETQNWRYAVKQFDPTKKIPTETWAALEQSLLLTPSSFGLQPWKFLIITSAELKQKLQPVSWNQPQVSDCSHHVVFTALKKMTPEYVQQYINSIAETRHVPVDSPSLAGLQKMILGSLTTAPHLEWNTRQAYIALGNFMTSAALLGVDTCPMEGIEANKYDEILGLTDYTTIVACPAGYRLATDKYATLAKVRFAAEQMVKHL
jgi:nitroreductase